MKSFLLLILSLMITGWEASSEVKGCTDGWVEFTCKYPKNNTYSSVDVVKDNQTIIETTQKNVRQTKGRFSVYNDGKNKSLRVVIKPLQQEDSGEYECKFDQESDPANEVDLRVDDGCQPQFNQTAYRTAKTTISCDKRNNSGVMFFCKENGSICEDISNGSFTLPETSSSFNMSISNVSSQHAGVYWCGVETNNGSNRAALRKIQLEVEGEKQTSDTFRASNNTELLYYLNITSSSSYICFFHPVDHCICPQRWSSNYIKSWVLLVTWNHTCGRLCDCTAGAAYLVSRLETISAFRKHKNWRTEK
ncbi:hypothetical protein PFLUV_G00049620 [Perca fluviatilis]|uniref:Immunoglobulin domain-containing protein n=1 Tax=Perca fluviatilis TaxID=8168 RepID=A0A6A5FM61_PERFL|nr:hypothetical protein PFLUV_G00049620 [Perca fluviatilis]